MKDESIRLYLIEVLLIFMIGIVFKPYTVELSFNIYDFSVLNFDL